GVRVDTYGYAGYRTNPNFDSLLAKVIVKAPTFDAALAKAGRALAGFRLDGAPSNIGFLRALIADKDVRTDKVHTRFVDEHAKKLIASASKLNGGRYFQTAATGGRQAGAKVDAVDPLAVLSFGKSSSSGTRAHPLPSPPREGEDGVGVGGAVAAPIEGTSVSLAGTEGVAVG